MAKELIIAKSLKEVASLMRKGAAVLAGGTEVNRLDSGVKASTLVSIGRLEELDGIYTTVLDKKKYVRIGSTCTFQEVIDCSVVPEYFKTACRFMSSRTKRNMATIGGNVAVFRDDSYLWSTLLACHAGIVILKGGKEVSVCSREYACDAKLRKYLVVSVLIPVNAEVFSKRYANTAASHACLTVSCSKEGKNIIFGVCAKNSGVFFFNGLENVSVPFKDDMFGSKKYKSYLLKVTSEDLAKAAEGESK